MGRRPETSDITCQTAAVLTDSSTYLDLLWLRGRQRNIRNDPLYTQDEKGLIIRELEVIRSQINKQFFCRFSVRMNLGALGVSTALEDNILKLRLSAFMLTCDADVQGYLTSSLSHTSRLIPR
ncbi:hypothetical protein EV401DRAFT_1969286 [Pisolithus croceorrhizus]|nr:hypothetical protein EV401DRAFT_1969286 [Pisolithus croceorrhizus]